MVGVQNKRNIIVLYILTQEIPVALCVHKNTCKLIYYLNYKICVRTCVPEVHVRMILHDLFILYLQVQKKSQKIKKNVFQVFICFFLYILLQRYLIRSRSTHVLLK